MNTVPPAAIEATGQQDRATPHVKEGGFGDADPRAPGELERYPLPQFHSVLVGFSWKLGDGQVPMLVEDRGLRARTTERRTGRQYQREVFRCFFISSDSVRRVEQCAQSNQRGDLRRGRQMASSLDETKGPEPRLVRYAEHVVQLRKGSEGALVLLREPSLSTLHQLPAPAIRCTDRRDRPQ
jgi:hypothetical protein